MQNLYLLQYNNYYNRIRKTQGNRVNDYAQFIVIPLLNTNFNPNDGIDTTHIVNGVEVQDCDYCIVADENMNIISKWFIIESKRNLGGQYTLTLHRDVVVDFEPEIAESDAFIEKATITDYRDPAIFNDENMEFNQIKTSEVELKDRTNTAWVVGYVESVDSESEDITIEDASQINLAAVLDTLPSTEFTVVNGPILYKADVVSSIGSRYKYYSVEWESNNPVTVVERPSTTQVVQTDNPKGLMNYLAAYNFDQLDRYVLQNAGIKLKNDDTFNTIKNNVGNMVSLGGSIYQIQLESVTEDYVTYFDAGSFKSTITGAINAFQGATSITGNPYTSLTPVLKYKFKYVSLGDTYTTRKVKIPISRKKLKDAPYDMFCMPLRGLIATPTNYAYMYDDDTISLATEISRQLGARCYDIQLLPYCPLTYGTDYELDYTASDNELRITPIGSIDVDYSYIFRGNSEIRYGVLFWCSRSKGEINIPCTININDYKMESQTDVYRLCSPNYNGQFEFNAAKNGGVSSINVDWNYKPYQPYLHLNPDFGRLYGRDFNDARGLICGGDFSLPKLSDAWVNYVNNNKAYEQQFDRQIQNMEVNNRMGLISDIGNAVAGTGAGIAGGVTAGKFLGGVGGIATGVASGVASAAAGIADIAINQALRNETLDYTKDMHGFNMQNIKAMPTTISNVSAFTPNNKIFPILEYYTCTDAEKEALRNKIRYNGMTVGRIGRIGDWIDNGGYFKCRIIRCLGVHDDYHLMKTISDELMKGVFV